MGQTVKQGIFMYCGIIKKIFFILLFLMQFGSLSADELYFIDAHSQVDTEVPINTVISLMNSVGIRHTILSARGNLKGKVLIKLSKENYGRITPALRTKGKSYDADSKKYYQILKKQTASNQYHAIAEILLYHAQKGNKVPEIIVYPDDKRVLAALNIAIERGWPFVIHIEFASLKGKMRKIFMRAFKQMLDQHPKQAFILTHMGQLSGNECLSLIKSHNNIYFHTGWTNPVAVDSSNQPWTNVFEGNHLSPQWKDIFCQYPKKFIFALDNVFAKHWSDFYQKQMIFWKRGFAELPEDVSHLIAHGNAERLWNISLEPL